MEKDNKIIYVLLTVIICLLTIIIILVINNKNSKLVVEDNTKSEKINTTEKNYDDTKEEETITTEKSDDDTKKEAIDYESYKGKWCHESEDDIIINSISNNSISFSWGVFRTFSIDVKTKMDDNIAKFYYKAYSSPNSKEMTNNQVTIELSNNKLIVTTKKVDNIDENYELIDDDRGLGNLSHDTYEYTRECLN